ncbi:hypothetical protein ACS0TY_028993 [Phlomoides rotata]
MDPENYDGTAEDLELEWRPATSEVEKKGRRNEVHQILRIRAEDLHLREDHVGEGKLRLNEGTGVVRFVLFSRRASRLSARTASTEEHQSRGDESRFRGR